MMAWNGYDSNIPFLLRGVSENVKANWQAPKHSSYLWQTEQARKLDTVVSFPLEFDHGAQVWTWPASAITIYIFQ